MSNVTSESYAVTGMTCGHCVGAVVEELQALEPVTDVTVDLVAGGASTVRITSVRPLEQGEVRSALAEAGDYHLA